ncbi:hypothetical protein KUCAC02_015408, partial [Chaenocephalus aceratus]
ALRSCNKSSKPVYVSVGHRISLDTAVRLTHSCCRYRVPEPIRQIFYILFIADITENLSQIGVLASVMFRAEL